ncbi:MAG: peptidoglycan-binding protein, partial [Pseudogulbenkiania sp.]|nr:peptidoglycan-binding protein [Pseudogulbenkiania sp.]
GALLSATALATALLYYAEPFGRTRPALAKPTPASALAGSRTLAGDPVVTGTLHRQEPLTASVLESSGHEALKQAYRALLARWNIPAQVDDEQSACLQAEAFGLHCLSESGDLEQLRRLDRPAVLQLRLPNGRVSHLILTALQEDRATLMSGKQTRTLTESALKSIWTGRYTLLWKAPPNYQEPLARGSRGRMVAWLRHQLGLHQAPPAVPPKEWLFDTVLEEQVMRFQRSDGLPADGIVGPHTLIRLTRASDTTSPRLIGTTMNTATKE